MAGKKLLFTEEEWNLVAPDVARQMHEFAPSFCTAISKHLGEYGESWGTGSNLKLDGSTVIQKNEHVATAPLDSPTKHPLTANNNSTGFGSAPVAWHGAERRLAAILVCRRGRLQPSHGEATARMFGEFGGMRDGLNRRLRFLLIAGLRWFGLFSRRKRILRFFRRAKAPFIGAGPEESGQCRFLSPV